MSDHKNTENDNEVGTNGISKSHEKDSSVNDQTMTNVYEKENRSPLVTSIEWGRVDVKTFGEYKDVKLYPGGAEPWDWAKTDTHHQPGIKPADVQILLKHGCKILILSRGMKEMLHTSDETHQFLKDNHMEINKDYFILQSEAAIDLYNKYVNEKEPVGALIHSTC